ncbi:GIY-YIG nuclease family protein [Gordonia sp. (in: high G+C Gram-positive bacteria)]|uniref:GIY-YIG nuclease family protein n=1 Tax=Gordonia sp. (in: high G+C Gram-positive bacteria) TaxID=84139 RepID=UPI0039E4256D
MYILECSDGSYYVGSTWDLSTRLDQHMSGTGSAYTSGRLPVALVYSVESDSIREVWEWERRVHGWSRAKRRALIDGRFDLLPGLSANRQATDDGP